MLSTRLTGSSTSITVVSSRSARSIPVAAPAWAKCSATKRSLGIARARRSPAPTSAVDAGGSRSKNAARYAATEPVDASRRPAHPSADTSGSRRTPRRRPDPDCTTLTCLRDFLAEQVEGDAVVADHRFAHRADRAVQRGQHSVGADADLVVVGVEALGDDVGVLELVALHAARRLEADGERRQAVLAGLGEQARRSGWSRRRRTAGTRPGRRRRAGARPRSAARSEPRLPSRVRTSRRGPRAW